MKVIRFLAVPLLFLASILGVGIQNPHFPTSPMRAEASDEGDRVLVKFKYGVPASERAAAHRQVGGRPVEVIPGIDVDVVAVPQGKGKGAIAGYQRNPRVQFAEADVLVMPEEVPDDPYYSNEWQLSKIDAPGAWGLAKATGILIAICDTGIQPDHPDLAPVLRGDLGYNSADGSTNWLPVNSHGTKVAGAAAAATNNGIGVAGVAWGAQIIPVRITNRSDGGALISDAARCITYAADRGARAINVSYLVAGSSTIDSAGQYAQGKGAITTVAAGNYAEDPGWPNYPGFVAVSNTNKSDSLYISSNFGTFVDTAAPGAAIWTTRTDTLYGDVYGPFSGTSASAPVATGVVALIFGANPGLSAGQAQDILFSNTDDLGDPGWDPYFGHGRVNAHKAVAAVLGSISTVGTIAGTVTSSSGGTPISGATVTDGTRTASANSSGVYVLTEVPEGTYTVTSSAAGYNAASKMVSVLAGNTATANFSLGASTGAISGMVTEAAGGMPISGATVTDGTRTASTNSSGIYSLTEVPEGTFTVTGSATNYNTSSQAVTVVAGSTATASFALTADPPAPSPEIILSSINPDKVKRGASIQLTIAGAGFVPGATVSFEKGDGPAPTASSVVLVNSATITATVSAKNGGPPRISRWDVRVTNPDGVSGALNGLTVVP